MTAPVENNAKTAWAHRPTPEEVGATLSKMKDTEEVIQVPALVATLRRETGCSRATAYRAVSDAFAAGIIERSERQPTGQSPTL